MSTLSRDQASTYQWTPASAILWLRQYDYEWRLASHDLMPPRENCSKDCLTADADWTGWRNFSKQDSSSKQPPSAEQWRAVTWRMMLGTPLLSGSARQQLVMNSPALKNVLLLRTSKYLICDELRERLTVTPVSAMRRWNDFVYAREVSRTFGKTSTWSSRPVSSNSLWTGEHDPIQDVIDWTQRMREEHWQHVK